MKTPKDYVLLFLKGMGMGGFDLIPGVSGGTIAFITGIYEELITSIKSIDLEALKLLTTGNISSFWKKINGWFLLVLLSGILASLISLATLISGLLQDHPIQLWSFFFGLIAISAIVVCRDIRKWRVMVILCLLLGCVLAYLITGIGPSEIPDSIPFIFISGAIAICAMILPGISGSFLLIMLGKYTFILKALIEFNLEIILIFSSGCLLGLIAFSRLISWLFKKYHDITIAILAGFMIGSLNKVWPWKQTVSTFIDRHEEIKPLVQENVLPNTYQVLGNEAFLWQAILYSILGVGVVIVLEKLAVSRKNG